MKDDAMPLTLSAPRTTGQAQLQVPGKVGVADEALSTGQLFGGAILLLLAVVAFVLTRRKGRLERRMQLLESLSLGPRRSMCLVRVDGRVLVMGVSEAGVQLLTTHALPAVGEALEAVPAPSAQGGFEQLLGSSFEEQDLRARLAASQRVGP